MIECVLVRSDWLLHVRVRWCYHSRTWHSFSFGYIFILLSIDMLLAFYSSRSTRWLMTPRWRPTSTKCVLCGCVHGRRRKFIRTAPLSPDSSCSVRWYRLPKNSPTSMFVGGKVLMWWLIEVEWSGSPFYHISSFDCFVDRWIAAQPKSSNAMCVVFIVISEHNMAMPLRRSIDSDSFCFVGCGDCYVWWRSPRRRRRVEPYYRGAILFRSYRCVSLDVPFNADDGRHAYRYNNKRLTW